MKMAVAPVRFTLAALLIAACGGPVVAQGAAQSAGSIALASHRAVYDLKLAQTRGKRPMNSVRGRILYDFSGSACEGYALQFRQVSELDSGEGKTMVSDLRATTFEEAGSKSLRFHSQNFIDDQLRDAVDGQAERAPEKKGIVVRLTEPTDKSFDLGVDLIFPTEHVRRIIEAAKQGKTILEVAVYDGSESGEKTYDTLTVIGHAIAPDPAKKLDDAAGKENALAGLTRWPVTISYFDKGKTGGEQTPIYAITFELYENGVSRSLLLDYNDFVVSGEMTSIEMKNEKPCP
ncbi:MAG: cell envelope integrity EipB family protein [Pseudomonadota bacterium]